VSKNYLLTYSFVTLLRAAQLSDLQPGTIDSV